MDALCLPALYTDAEDTNEDDNAALGLDDFDAEPLARLLRTDAACCGGGVVVLPAGEVLAAAAALRCQARLIAMLIAQGAV